MRPRVRDEGGFTLVELLVAMLAGAILMAGLVDVFVSGTRAAAEVSARTAAQQDVRLALDRLEYEARCATTASIAGGGAGVSLVLPAQCVHGVGDVCWEVASGVLTRYASASCTGSGQAYVGSIASATPFSIETASGDLPRLQVQLTVDTTPRAADALTVTDTITLRNAARS